MIVRIMMIGTLIYITPIFSMSAIKGLDSQHEASIEEEKKDHPILSYKEVKGAAYVQKKLAQYLLGLKELEKMRRSLEKDKAMLFLEHLPKVIRHTMVRTYFDQIEYLSVRYRESLLPAIIPKAPPTISHRRLDFSTALENGANKCSQLFMKRNRSKKQPYIYSMYMVGHKQPVFKDVPRNKNATYISHIIGRPLKDNEYAVVGWSNGDQQIAVSCNNLHALRALSYDQLMFIKSLYKAEHITLSDQEWHIFDSLDAGIRNNLRSYYPQLDSQYGAYAQAQRLKKEQTDDRENKIGILQRELLMERKDKERLKIAVTERNMKISKLTHRNMQLRKRVENDNQQLLQSYIENGQDEQEPSNGSLLADDQSFFGSLCKKVLSRLGL